MKKTLAAIIIAAVAAFMPACSRGSGDVAVPRPVAYPRIEVPDSAFCQVDSLPIVIEANSDARVRVTRREGAGVWVDVTYPRLNVSINITLSPVTAETFESVIDNRSERISLNLGGAETEVTSLISDGGFASEMYYAPEVVTTPVQFLATDGHKHVVSGACYIPDATVAKADSLRPVAAMLRRDVLHILKTLRHE